MKTTPANKSTRKFSEAKPRPVILPIVERLGTRSQYDQIPNNVGEFVDSSDVDTATWVGYLLAKYTASGAMLDDDADFRRRLMRNANAVIRLARSLHRYNRYGDIRLDDMGGRRPKLLSSLVRFVDTSDQEAASWVNYLLAEYIGSEAILQDDADVRQRLIRNTNAVIQLARTLHEHNQRGGVYELAGL